MLALMLDFVLDCIVVGAGYLWTLADSISKLTLANISQLKPQFHMHFKSCKDFSSTLDFVLDSSLRSIGLVCWRWQTQFLSWC